MKKMILLITVLMLAGSSMVLAQVDDVLGFYWDTDGITYEDVDYEAFMSGHLIIKNPSFTTFKSVEIKLDSDFGYTGTIGQIPGAFGSTIQLGGLPNIIYSVATPYAFTGDLEIFTITFLNSASGLDARYATDLCNFYVNPVDAASLPNAVIAQATDGGDFISLTPTSPFGMPIAIMNGNGVVAEEHRTFGDIKSLYR